MEIIHVGPDTNSHGGMAAVVRTMIEVSPYPARALPSWRPELSTGKQIRLVLTTVVALVRARSRRKSQVVHLHVSERGSFYREGSLAIVARLLGYRVVATLHGADFSTWIAAAARNRRIARTCLLRCGAVTALFQGHADELAALCKGRVPVFVVRNAVLDRQPESPMGRANSTKVVFAGVVGRRKGADLLLSAWALLEPRIPAKYALVLAGPSREGLDMHSDPRTKFLGELEPEASRALISEAYVVVLPSRAEALPMTLVEAMSSGCPFVATPVGGIADLAVSGAGLVVEPTAEAIADAIEQLLASPQLATQMGERGREWWFDNASPKAVSEQFANVYATAVRSRH